MPLIGLSRLRSKGLSNDHIIRVWPYDTDLTRTHFGGVKTLLLFEIKDHSIDHKGPEDKEDAGQHPHLDSGEALSFGWVGVDVVEDVDEDKEESDKQRHAPRDDVRGDEEWDPRDQDEEAGGKVIGDDVGHHMTRQILQNKFQNNVGCG